MFKRAQDTKGLDKFWPKIFEDWYICWLIPHSPSLARSYGTIKEGRLVLQKEKNVVRNSFQLLYFHHANPTLARKSSNGSTTGAVVQIP